MSTVYSIITLKNRKSFHFNTSKIINDTLKNRYIISNKISKIKAKTRVKSKFAIKRKSVSYKVVQEKVLSSTSKGH